jgi:hypothetical protein
MAVAEKLLVSMPIETVKMLANNGRISECVMPKILLPKFVEVISEYIASRVGIRKGPLLCLSWLSGERVSSDMPLEMPSMSITDLLLVGVGDAILEFAVPRDQIVSIDVEKVMKLAKEAETYGEDDDGILEELSESLILGIDANAENVYSFTPELTASQFVRGYTIDDEWDKADYNVSRSSKPIQVTELKLFNFE